MSPAALRAESRRRFPLWSRSQRARWVLARLRAARLTPHYAKLLPMYAHQIGRRESVFAPRTLQEARQ